MKNIRPTVFFFDDDPVMAESVHAAMETITFSNSFRFGEGAPLDFPELRIGSSDFECMELIRNFRRDNHLPLFIIDLFLDHSNSGYSLIREVRKKRSLRLAPVIVLTSHYEKDFVNRCYQLGANSYIVKSDDPEELEERLLLLVKFWLLNVSSGRALSSNHEEFYFSTDIHAR